MFKNPDGIYILNKKWEQRDWVPPCITFPLVCFVRIVFIVNAYIRVTRIEPLGKQATHPPQYKLKLGNKITASHPACVSLSHRLVHLRYKAGHLPIINHNVISVAVTLLNRILLVDCNHLYHRV